MWYFHTGAVVCDAHAVSMLCARCAHDVCMLCAHAVCMLCACCAHDVCMLCTHTGNSHRGVHDLRMMCACCVHVVLQHRGAHTECMLRARNVYMVPLRTSTKQSSAHVDLHNLMELCWSDSYRRMSESSFGIKFETSHTRCLRTKIVSE